MWPDCLKNLNSLDAYEISFIPNLPEGIKKIFREIGITEPKEMYIPIHFIKRLGECSTAAFPECFNLPEWHQENSEMNFGDDNYNYLERMGGYIWFDCDLEGEDGNILQLRTVYNVGDPDCNDGYWGEVWERNTGELVADLISSGDGECTIEAVSEDIIRNYKPHKLKITFHDVRGDSYSMDVVYQNNLELEKVIALAIALDCFFSYQSPT